MDVNWKDKFLMLMFIYYLKVKIFYGT